MNPTIEYFVSKHIIQLMMPTLDDVIQDELELLSELRRDMINDDDIDVDIDDDIVI